MSCRRGVLPCASLFQLWGAGGASPFEIRSQRPRLPAPCPNLEGQGSGGLYAVTLTPASSTASWRAASASCSSASAASRASATFATLAYAARALAAFACALARRRQGLGFGPFF